MSSQIPTAPQVQPPVPEGLSFPLHEGDQVGCWVRAQDQGGGASTGAEVLIKEGVVCLQALQGPPGGSAFSERKK